MSNQQIVTPNLLKNIIQRINLKISTYNKKNSVNIWHSVFKWNYDHHFMKNFLKLTNKTLKGLNKYHVFRMQYIYTFIGLGLGLLVTQAQRKIQKIQNLQFKPAVVDIIKQKVFQNEMIRLKLQQAVNDNVLQNQDIQTNLHYILINKVLLPQKQNLPKIVTKVLLTLLKSQQIFQISKKLTVQVIEMNKNIIAKQALNFLGGQLMLNIIKNIVAPLIKGQIVQEVVSRQLIKNLKSQLHKQQNMEKGYEFIRQKII